jgi:hypothetical protein
MTTVTNNFEGGTNGATITTSNAGGAGNTQFSITNDGSGAGGAGSVLIFDNTHVAHGSLAMKVSSANSGGPGVFLQGPSGTTAYARFYFYATAAPSANTRLFEVLNSANNVVGATMYWQTDRTFRTTNKNNSGGTTTSVSVPLNTWVRVELKVTLTTPGSGGSCTHQLRLYNSADSTTTSSDTTATNQPVNASELGTFQFGNYFASSTFSAVWFDDVGASDSAWLGPATSGPATVTGSSSPSATASLSASGKRKTFSSSSLAAAAAQVASGVVKKLASAALSASSTSTADGGVYTAGSATLAATASIGSTMGHHTAVAASTTNLAVGTVLLSGSHIEAFAEAGFTALATMEADASVPVIASADLDAESGLLHFEYEIFLAVATVIVADANTAHVTYGLHQYGLITGDGS